MHFLLDRNVDERGLILGARMKFNLAFFWDPLLITELAPIGSLIHGHTALSTLGTTEVSSENDQTMVVLSWALLVVVDV
jgi:hypothetical protein